MSFFSLSFISRLQRSLEGYSFLGPLAQAFTLRALGAENQMMDAIAPARSPGFWVFAPVALRRHASPCRLARYLNRHRQLFEATDDQALAPAQ